MGVVREVKEGRIVDYKDPDTAEVAIQGQPNKFIFDPGVQLRIPSPPQNIYFLSVTITTPQGINVIERDIKKR